MPEFRTNRDLGKSAKQLDDEIRTTLAERAGRVSNGLDVQDQDDHLQEIADARAQAN